MNVMRWSYPCLFLIFYVVASPVARGNDSDLDLGFGNEGVAFSGLIDSSGGASKCRPVVQTDGKILTCGTRFNNGSSGSDFFVQRLTADG